jgi:MFS family permease
LVEQRSGGLNFGALASLILGRVVYAVNWYSLAAVFSFTASELKLNAFGLGLVTAAFFVGVGAFQVPGGIMAARMGPRLTVIFGTTVSSLSAFLTGFVGNLTELVILRFFVGLGMAFVFAPGVILMAKYLREGSAGLGVGLYNSAFSLGSILSLSGLPALALIAGWRGGVVMAGLLGLVTVVLIWILVPRDSTREEFKVETRHLKFILLDKWLIVLSIAMLGLQVGSTVYGVFMAYYLKSVVKVPNVVEAGIIASLVSIFALTSAPISGRIFDRSGRVKQLMFVSGLTMAIGLGVAFLGAVYAAVISGIMVGLASGIGFTFGFAAARAANRLDKEYETLAVSWVNSISLLGNSVPSLLYSYIALQYGYAQSGISVAVLALIMFIPVLFTKYLNDQANYKTRSENR